MKPLVQFVARSSGFYDLVLSRDSKAIRVAIPESTIHQTHRLQELVIALAAHLESHGDPLDLGNLPTRLVLSDQDFHVEDPE